MDKKTAVDELRRQIGAFLRGETEFSAFSRNYVEYFADRNVDAEFDAREHELYGALFERLQWTAPSPSGLDRASGYHTEGDTTSWMRTRFEDLT